MSIWSDGLYEGSLHSMAESFARLHDQVVTRPPVVEEKKEEPKLLLLEE